MWKQILKYAAIGSGVVVAVVTFFQWKDAHHNFKVDERAWLGVTTAPNYTTDPNGKIIVLAQLQNFGKTPARIVEGKAIGTIWEQGEEPDFSAEIKPLHRPALSRLFSHHRGSARPSRRSLFCGPTSARIPSRNSGREILRCCLRATDIQ